MSTVTKFANANTVVTTGFTNPTNAYVDDGSYATALPGKNLSVVTDYGFPAFTTSDIPTGAVINSVKIEIQFKISTINSIATMGLQINNNGSLQGSRQDNTAEPAGDTLLTHTITSGVTQTDLQTANLVKARVSAIQGNSSTAVTFSVDYVSMTVTYNIPPTVALNSPANAGSVGATPTLNFTGTDADGDTVEYNARVWSGSSAKWYNSAWTYRVKVSTLATKVDADLTGYVVYVDLANLPAGFHSHVNATDARDIRVTTSDGVTELPREVVRYDAATDTGELHFRGDVLDASDTDFYIYYGNAAATEPAVTDTYGRNAVWVDYRMVLHGSLTDVTGNTTPTQANVTVSYTTQKKVGNDSLEFPSSSTSRNITANIVGRTITMWARNEGALNAYVVDSRTALAAGYLYWDNASLTWSFGGDYTNVYKNGVAATTNVTTYATNTWYHVGIRTAAQWTNTTTKFGIRYTTPVTGDSWDGQFDEIRVTKTADRASTWMTTEYNNHNSPSTFYSVGSEETLILNKLSASDTGFTAGHPFTSGVAIDFTVQAGDALAAGTYYWSVAAIDPSGSNTYGVFATVRSFTVVLATNQTITGVARIQVTTTKTITGKGRITVTTTQTITGLAKINVKSFLTETGVARITSTTTRTETGVARIQVTTTKTETGVSRITIVTTRTITGVSRITANTLRTITGTSRITTTTTRTETGVARVTKTNSQTITGVSNITPATVTTTQDITGKSRITITTQKTETGVSRITSTTTRTETGTARITVSTTKTITGISRITKTTTQTITGKSRITVTTTKTETGVARITKTTTQTESGKARITITTTQTITGKSRITVNTLKTETGVARITAKTNQDITGKAKILVTGTTQQDITGKAKITATTQRSITGTSRITKTTTQTETGKARIAVTTSQTETGKARITNTGSQTETGVVRITAKTNQNITGTAKIASAVALDEYYQWNGSDWIQINVLTIKMWDGKDWCDIAYWNGSTWVII